MKPVTRALTPSEEYVVSLIKLLDKTADEKRHFITLCGGREATEAIGKLEVAKYLRVKKCTFDSKANKFAITFDLANFYRYLLLMLQQAGLSLQPDGSLRTYDNLIIASEYLQ